MLVIALVTLSVLLAAAVLGLARRQDSTAITSRLEALARELERSERTIREQLQANRVELADNGRRLADSLVQTQSALGDAQGRRLAEHAAAQEQKWGTFLTRLDALRAGMETRIEHLRGVVDQRLREIQQENAAKLDQMRQTVDEKLQTTLETRLGESFRQVSDRLEQVYKGLGEMQVLATGVGDLKRVLGNVKTRGTWGEVQLAALLEQVLAADQYAANVATSDTGGERVEFAIRLPGRSGGHDDPMWLPIDAKFPLEDYQSLVEAAECGDTTTLDEAGRRLEARVKACAKDIRTKYLNPPRTTDFAIMFLPNEGLYAEVLRRAGLAEGIQREHRVVIAGPTNLWAILNSLQMGFRTLAIERRSSEVSALLGAVKTEFGHFGKVLDGVQKNLQHAATKIDAARTGTRKIERKLNEVQALPAGDATALLDGAVFKEDELAAVS